jgi:two-component system chemotaxis sensor kinase CheA
VELVTDGEDTEIDRTMVDVLADPLVHMVRNSLDHGLESPEERVEAGKPKKGKVRISAFQAGGNVVIEVADDGRGLNREKILAKAIERGVVESDRGMTDREIYNLIFAPGFSTAEKITEVSGRGVGMDVVRRNVESLRGRVSIDSEPGRGSVFSIHLPLTLAITDGMVIRIGSQRYIIPSVKIHMSLRPDRKAISTVSGKGEMVMIQGDLLPIIRMHRLWNIPDAVEDPTEGLVVIVGEGRHRSALLVDELVTQQQFVVKPLSGVVANTQGVAGGAIMGNGDVGLILDPEGIIALAHGMAHSAAA